MARTMTSRDQLLFYLDISSLKWDECFPIFVQGARQYLSNESPTNLDEARKKDKMYLSMKYEE